MSFYKYSKGWHCIKNASKNSLAILTLTLRCVTEKNSVDKNNKRNQT